MRAITSMFGGDLAIDLGTANTLIYAKGLGLICDAPSVIAFYNSPDGSRRLLAVGADAKRMLGRAPGSITVTRPLRDGVIADFQSTRAMVQHLIDKTSKHRGRGYNRIVVCVPCSMTSLERRGVEELVEAVGCREAYLLEEPLAAAFGAGMPVSQPVGSMIIDIGGGTAEIAVISLSGIVYSNSLRIAGDRMNEAIVHKIKRDHNLQIGEQTAELIKIKLGSARPDDQIRLLQLRGRDLETRKPRTIDITDNEIREALLAPLQELITAIRATLEQVPPELAADLLESGIVLAGGGALLRNLDTMLEQEVGIPTKVANDPLKTVVMGAGRLLEEPSILRDIAIH